MVEHIVPYLEALKLLKSWSTTLLILQSVFLMVLTLIVLLIDKEKLNKGSHLLKTSLIFFALSILIAINLIGTIPWSIQKLPELVTEYHDIYQFPNYIGIPIWMIAFGQHITFFIALVCFIVFIIFNQRIEEKEEEI